MKLQELVEKMLEKQSSKIHELDDTVRHDTLELYKDELSKCKEFENVELHIISLPIIKNDSNQMFTAETVKISDMIKFKNKYYLHSITLSPTMYDPKDLDLPVKNNATITPLLYSPVDFTPFKTIKIRINPEISQGVNASEKEKEYRKYLHALLDKILDNPENFTPKGYKNILIRGIAETKIVDGVEKTRDLGFLYLDYDKSSKNVDEILL